MTETTDALAHLHTRVVDAGKGYETGASLADAAELAGLFGTLLALHQGHARELGAALTARGVEPDADGSFLKYVHKAVLNLRSATTGLGASALPGIRDGEERLLDLYQHTVERSGDDRELGAILQRQHDELAAQVRLIAELERASGV